MPQPEPEETEKQPEEASQGIPVDEVIEDQGLVTALAAEKAKAEEYLAGWQRAQADFINYKRRCELEKEDLIKYGNAELLAKILPLLDDFELAFTHIPKGEAKTEFVKGWKALERKFKTILDSQGVTEIKALGEPFDPNLHEAMIQVDGEEGIIIQEFQKGYKLNDRVIRHSRVAVGSGRTKSDKEENNG